MYRGNLNPNLHKALERRGFNNIELMANCKELAQLSASDLQHSFEEPYALCTFSRVMKGKGIENLINAILASVAHVVIPGSTHPCHGSSLAYAGLHHTNEHLCDHVVITILLTSALLSPRPG